MRFKLDENLGSRGLETLRRAGYDAMTVREQSLCGSSDLSLIEICTLEKRCLITLDFDFANTLAYPPENYAGIVLIRLPRNPTLVDIESGINLLLELLNLKPVIEGQLWIIGQNRIRRYIPRSEAT